MNFDLETLEYFLLFNYIKSVKSDVRVLQKRAFKSNVRYEIKIFVSVIIKINKINL